MEQTSHQVLTGSIEALELIPVDIKDKYLLLEIKAVHNKKR